jgi:hypothetical protein
MLRYAYAAKDAFFVLTADSRLALPVAGWQAKAKLM